MALKYTRSVKFEENLRLDLARDSFIGYIII